MWNSVRVGNKFQLIPLITIYILKRYKLFISLTLKQSKNLPNIQDALILDNKIDIHIELCNLEQLFSHKEPRKKVDLFTLNKSISNSEYMTLDLSSPRITFPLAEKLHWRRHLQDKGSLSHPMDDQNQTLLQIYWAELEMKAGSNMKQEQGISSSRLDPHQRTPQETLLV